MLPVKWILNFSCVKQWWNSVDGTQDCKILFKLMNWCNFQIFWGVFCMLHIGICLSLFRSCSPEIFMSCRNLSEYKCHQNLVHSNHSFSTDCHFCKEHQNSDLNTFNLSLDPDLNFTVETDLSYSWCILPLQWISLKSARKRINFKWSHVCNSPQCCWFWEPFFKFQF